MSLGYEKISNAYVTIDGIHLPVLKIFETVDGVWKLKYYNFDFSGALIDFEYINNGDVTYTITDWKRTYQGEPSNRCVIPDYDWIKY